MTTKALIQTARKKIGNSQPIIPQVIAKEANPQQLILDFGAGKYLVHTQWLKEKGFKVVGYDIALPGSRQHLQHQYDIVFLSNVLNVQSETQDIESILLLVKTLLRKGGKTYFNFPKNPRKNTLTDKGFETLVGHIFPNLVKDKWNTTKYWKATK